VTEHHIPTPLELIKRAEVHPKTVEQTVQRLYPEPKPPLTGEKHTFFNPKEYRPRGPRPAVIRESDGTTVTHTQQPVTEMTLEIARMLADYDTSRLEVCPDGGIVVWNSDWRPPVRRRYVAGMTIKAGETVVAEFPKDFEAARSEGHLFDKGGELPPRYGMLHSKGGVLEPVEEAAIKAGVLDPKPKTKTKRTGSYKGRTPKLPPETIAELVKDRQTGVRAADLSEKYGISQPTVHRYLAKARKEKAAK
jgi:hypothetical protein